MWKLLVGASVLALSAACVNTSNLETEPVEVVTPPVEAASVEIETEATVEKVAFETYSAEAFFQTTSYGLASGSGYAWSSDGSKILAHSDESGVFNAIAIRADGSAEQLTASDTDAHFAQSFFPNDDRIIVTADQGGNELDHVYVRELDGTLVDVTPGESVKAFFGGWRADNDVFYVWHNGRDSANFDLYSVDPDDYTTSMVFENPGFQPGALSDSGRWLALDKPRTSADSDVYVVDLSAESPEPILVTEHEGNVAHGTYDFTPDETKLVYSTNEFGEFNQAWTHNLETGEKAPLIEADWDVSFVFYSPSGKYQVHAINADGLTDLTITDTESGEEVVLNGVPEGELGQIRFSRDESKIAFGLNTDTSPYNLYMTELGGEAVRLTDALNPEISEDNLVTATVERFEASDGVIIPGIMYKPKQASADNPVPAMVWVHGGPGGQSTRGYSATIQHMVNHGYAVYAANNRGSSGYGKTFFHMDDKRHGQEDLRDIVEAGHYLRGLDWVDADKVGVIGGSYGGYMTAAALTFHPEEFEVGINIFGVTNWVRTLQSIPDWWAAFREALYDEMGDPATDAERHRAISPLFHAENVTKPMLVVQGANDPRVLQVESDELVEAIRANGVYVEYVLFPDEGHGFLRKENRITASEAFVTFLDRFLKGEGEPEAEAPVTEASAEAAAGEG
ncbi:MAG: S9 family peptidase [Henriciella sp.]